MGSKQTRVNVLFYTLIAVFVLTTVVTLLGLTNIIQLEEKDKDRLITAFLVESATAVIALFTRAPFFKDESPPIITSPSLNPNTTNRKNKVIKKEKIFCASSTQWGEYGFKDNEGDISALKSAFGNNLLSVNDSLTSDDLTTQLVQNNFSIIHLVTYVSPKDGELIFSKLDKETAKPLTPTIDKMSADGLLSLIEINKPDLVVLGTCHALLLAAILSRSTNVIATDGVIRGPEVAKWSKLFYKLLSKGKTLSNAFDVATRNTRAPMYLIKIQDFKFEKSN